MPDRRSLHAFLASAVLFLCCSYVLIPRWQKDAGEATIAWDASGYYWPLPSFFIYKDAKGQHFADSVINKYHPTPDLQQAVHFQPGNDNYIFRYTFGMSILYSPFFFTAHALAEPLGFPADGFSRPYQFAIQTGGILVALLGLWYLRKLLLQYYPDNTVAIVLLLLCFGTNYLNYAAIDNSLSHSWLFSLYVFLLWNSHLFYQTPMYSYAARIGFLVGLIVLVRPPDIICCIIPLLWGMNKPSLSAIGERSRFIMNRFGMFFVAGVIAGMLIFVQLLYWELSTTWWVVDTYQGEKFTFNDPHFFDYMFSYRSGWATYTPMAFLFMAGFFLFLIRGKNKLPIVLFSMLNLYIVCSWEHWWYSGTGGRAMIQAYPVLLFPFAALVETAWKNSLSKWVFITLALVCIYCNAWITYHAHSPSGLYDSGEMNRQYFWNVIGKWSVPAEYSKMKDYDEYYKGSPKNLTLVYSNNFENETILHSKEVVIEGSTSYVIYEGLRKSPWFKFPVPSKNADRIRVQATFQSRWKEWNKDKWVKLMVRFYKGPAIVKEKMILVNPYLEEGVNKDIYIDVRIPREADSAGVSFQGQHVSLPIIIDNLKAWSFDEE